MSHFNTKRGALEKGASEAMQGLFTMREIGIRQCVRKYFIFALSLQQKPLLIYWELSGKMRVKGGGRRNQKRAKKDKKMFALSIHLCGRVSFTLKETYLEIF